MRVGSPRDARHRLAAPRARRSARALAGSQTCVSSAVHRRLRAGHGVGQRVVGVAGVAVQARLLVAQRQDLARRRGRLSCAPSCSPRLVQARQACSRRSRRSEKVRNGTMCERDRVTTMARRRCRGRRAAWRVAARTKSGRPARSASPRSTRRKPDSSASTFWPKRGGQVGQALHDLAHSAPARRRPGARRRARSRGGSARAGARCSRVEAERVAPLVQRVDAREQRRGAWRRGCSCAASRGAISRSTACSAGEVSLERQVVEQAARCGRAARPLRSNAATVFSKVGGSGRRPMASISARCSRIATLERRREVLGADVGERRQAVGGVPGLQQGVRWRRSFLALSRWQASSVGRSS